MLASCPNAGTEDAKLLHAKLKCGTVEPQSDRRAIGSRENSPGFFEGCENLSAFDLLECSALRPAIGWERLTAEIL